MKSIVFSLVIYKHKFDEIKPLLDNIIDFRNTARKFNINTFLLINDNSPSIDKNIERNLNKEFISFKFNYKNLGFGKSHNYNLIKNRKYNKDEIFIIINPDISFDSFSLIEYVREFYITNDVCWAPLIINKFGDIQYSAKSNPTILSLLLGRFSILRKFNFFNKYYKKHINFHLDYTKNKIKSSYLSGCFLVVKSKIYFKVHGFDERFFLHLEDADFSRKCSRFGNITHNPSCTVMHEWARGSHKSYIQTYHLIFSMFKYFFKWGFKII